MIRITLFVLFGILLLNVDQLQAQYEFTGKVNEDQIEGHIYLSVVEDYRKISGVFPEQILDETQADSLGNFRFHGNNLSTQNHIYRIHVDLCTTEEQARVHFTGHCPNSREVFFIANNNTQLELPFSFDNEMFCRVISTHEKANAFLKIDSLKNDMRYAFGTYRSEANRRINSKKWFHILHEYGAQLQEPLAELYSYAFLSDRSSDLYGYYLEDLKTNSYYDELLVRLEDQYPDSPYTLQYRAELESDKYLIQQAKTGLQWWVYLLAGVALVSILGNLYFKRKLGLLKRKEHEKASLTQQERRILELILQDKSNKEIAATMFVSVSTVKTHINNLYKKLQVGSRDEVKSLFST